MKNVEEMTIEEIYNLSQETNDFELLLKMSEELSDRAYMQDADGNLSKLYNLREQSSTLVDDEFFDNENIAEKYDWDYENECRAYNKSNTEIRDMLDENDKKVYVNYLRDCIGCEFDYLNGAWK